ncbi:hypothetical protein [Lewinella sp. IMCC34183]|uniref:hypothetical protein n=1 Tax=Lewinella sp. IMCC34183 TaxID=2248762 RepID=UPI00130031E2|nr:hypothetical protein [Lewinella sp. IMCC34183]
MHSLTIAPAQTGYNQPARRISTKLKVAYKSFIDAHPHSRRFVAGALLAAGLSFYK